MSVSVSNDVTFELQTPFEGHRLDTLPSSTVTVSRNEMFKYLEDMLTVRRMEMAADSLYKSKMIRGFCHLSIGQEAIPVGLEAALTKEDAVITAYRCHGFAYVRGASVHGILAELLGKATGVSRGKGGSMHMFAPQFYGGNGIVGAQVPVGAGIAWTQKYLERAACTFALYGDGAANQGQIFEVYNMAALMKLPVVFVCENNKYGMGTSMERSAASTTYYRRGDYLPGLRVDGMDVLAVREAGRFAKDYAIRNGPIVLEMVTYRYQGHSMSDPGTTYRTRDEVQQMRSTRDTIKLLQSQLLGSHFATEDDLRALETKVRDEIDAAVRQAKEDPLPAATELTTDIYARDSEPDGPVRGCEP